MHSANKFRKIALTDYGAYLLDDKGDLFSWSYDIISSSGLLNNSKRKQLTNGDLIKSPVKFTELSSGNDSIIFLDEFSNLWGMLDLSYYKGISRKKNNSLSYVPAKLNVTDVIDIFSDKYAHLILKKNGDVFIFGKVKNLNEILIINYPIYIEKLGKGERIIGFNSDVGFLVADSFSNVKLKPIVKLSNIKQYNFTKEFFLKLDGISLKNLPREIFDKYPFKPLTSMGSVNSSKTIKIEGGVDYLLMQVDNKIFINSNNLFTHKEDYFEVH